MRQVTTISLADLTQMAAPFDGELVKGVVDVVTGALILDMELHVDGEQHLLRSGSSQEHLWGVNLHPQDFGDDDFVEFDSMINIRPRQGNRSRGVEDPETQRRIVELITGIVHE